MCIAYAGIPEDNEISGVGYKVVIKNDDGTYSPFYTYAAKNGSGCSYKPLPLNKTFYIKNKMTYRMNKSYVVKHKRIAYVNQNSIESYLAGVHLYLDYKIALRFFHQEEYSRRERLSVIKCKYEKAIAIDRPFRVIVAKKITPIEEIMDSCMEM